MQVAADAVVSVSVVVVLAGLPLPLPQDSLGQDALGGQALVAG